MTKFNKEIEEKDKIILEMKIILENMQGRMVIIKSIVSAIEGINERSQENERQKRDSILLKKDIFKNTHGWHIQTLGEN